MKLIYPDLIRVTAVCMVVLIHISAPLLVRWGELSTASWMAANLYDSIGRCAVPLFVMLSGALLLGKQEPYLKFYQKRISRLMVPFLAWSAAFLLWRMGFSGQPLTAEEAFRAFYTGEVYYHLWYLYMILGLYLVTPLLRKGIQRLDPQDGRWFLVLWVLFCSLLPTLDDLYLLFVGYPLPFGVEVPTVMGYIGYYLMGYGLSLWPKGKPALKTAAGAFLVGTLGSVLGTWVLTAIAGSFQDLFYGYFTPNVVLQSVGAFLLLIRGGEVLSARLGPRLQQGLEAAGKLSFGVYLCHVMAMELLETGTFGFTLRGDSMIPIAGILVNGAVVYAVSLAFCALLSRIPYLQLMILEGVSRTRK